MGISTEPKYDEDIVNLGYLKKALGDTEEDIGEAYKNVSRHYASRPQPPYRAGDTWTDGDIIYTCINSRDIGVYNDDDWVTESGAKAEAERKNKVFLTQPSNYCVGDMWILQSDSDHRAGTRGEILITTAQRSVYDSDDWINIIGYGTIRSINEVVENLNNALDRIGVTEEAIADGIIITFYQETEPVAKHIGDLWFVTGENQTYIQGKLYRYDGINWNILDDPAITEAFTEANEARIVADGKIQSFYAKEEPYENCGAGDLWIDINDNNKLYRYNGTNWIAVYDTRIDTIQEEMETIVEVTTEISTDLGRITEQVTTLTTGQNENSQAISALELTTEGISATVDEHSQKVETLENITEETIETITKLGEIKETELAEYISVDASYNPAIIEIHGESKQETRSGKNLLKLNASRVSNGITITNNLDGTLIFNGTATANFDIWIANGYSSTEIVKEFPAGTKIAQKLNIINGTVVGTYRLRTIVHNGTVLDWNTVSNDTVYTFPMNGNIRCTDVYVTAGTIFNNFKFFPQLEIGAVSSEPEQYGVMPSPGFISPIKSVNSDKLNIICRNKNQFNLDSILYSNKIIKMDTGIKLNGAFASNVYSEKELKRVFKPNTWYTIKATSKIISKPSTEISTNGADLILYRPNNHTEGEVWTPLYTNVKDNNVGYVETFINKFKTPADLSGCLLNSYAFYGNNDGSTTGAGTGEIEITDIMLVEGQYTSANFPEFEKYEEKKYELKNSNIFSMEDWYDTIHPLNPACMEKVNFEGFDYVKVKPNALNYNYEYMSGQFEENTQYTVRFRGRQFEQTAETSSGLAIYYTDGTYETIYVQRSYTESDYVLTSQNNKTISYIGIAYENPYFILVRDVEIRKNIVLNGLEEYKDLIYKNGTTWYTEQKVERINLADNTANWSYNSTYKYAINLLSRYGIEQPPISNPGYDLMSNMFTKQNITQIRAGNEGISIGNNSLNASNSYVLVQANLNSLVEYQTFITTNEPYVILELATPIITEITDMQLLEGLESIYTEKGFNYITIENSDVKPKFKLKYYENNNINETLATKNELNKVEKDLSAEIIIKNDEVKTSVQSEVTTSLLTLINNKYLTSEQVQALVGGTAEDITTIKNQLTQTITDRDMQIAITTAINDGVSYFKNTLFTINEEGMWIATTADEFSAKYDNKGMYLYSFNEMIAKYDKDGATLHNLKVEGTIEMQNLRIVNVTGDLGEDRVHIHWIGGGI